MTTLFRIVLAAIERAAALADSQDTSATGLTLAEDYQALSTREEQDFLSVMKETDSAISDAEAFTEKLTTRLSMLDGVRGFILFPNFLMSSINFTVRSLHFQVVSRVWSSRYGKILLKSIN